MATRKRQKLVIANAINMVVEINEHLVKCRKRGEVPDIRLPGAFDRAFLVHHEAGAIPLEETVSDVRGES
jgi:hypothetical protein